MNDRCSHPPSRALAAFLATVLLAGAGLGCRSGKGDACEDQEVPALAASAAVNPLFAKRELFLHQELILQREPTRSEGIDLRGGDPLARALAEVGATDVTPAFRSLDRARRTSSALARRAAERFPDRAARAPEHLALPALEHTFLVRFAAPTDVVAAAARLSATAGVVYAEPNFLYQTFATPLPDEPFVPDDRYVSTDGLFWSQGSFGQPFSDLFGIERVRAIEGWNRLDTNDDGIFAAADGEIAPGAGVVVAVVDAGVDLEHPELRDNLWVNEGEIPDNGVDDDANGFVDDVHGWDFVADDAQPEDRVGHGTHVAGTIAATADNRIGVVGVAPFAQLMVLKGLGDGGIGNVLDLADAVIYAATMGADVISNSWGGPALSATLQSAFEFASSVGALSVAAAGNGDQDMRLVAPATYETVIAVAAVDAANVRAPFSNFGPGVDIAAPGVEVLSLNANAGANLIAESRPERVVDDDTLVLSGTSMACPHVSGAAAVLLSQRPDESAAVIRARLLAGAVPIAALNPGFEAALGRGRLDLEATLLAVPQPLLRIARVDAPGLEPGADVTLRLVLENRWLDVGGIRGTLATSSPYVTVLKAEADFGDLPFGEQAENAADPFQLVLASSTPRGEDLAFTLELRGDDGYAESFALSLRATQFGDVSVEVGLPVSEFTPWSAELHDADGDADVDAQWVGFFENAFYRNQAGSFERDVDTGVEPPVVGSSQTLFLDIEGDGDQDIFWAGFNTIDGSRMYRNEGDGRYADITDASGVRGLRAFAAAAFDYDGDGLVDFVGGSEQRGEGFGERGLFLMRNNGDGTFSDVAREACLDTSASLLIGQALTFDYDGDGGLDLLLPTASGIHLYRNQRDGRYRDVTRESGILPEVNLRDCFADECAFETATRRANRAPGCAAPPRVQPGGRCDPGKAFGGAVGDYDNDGDQDLFLTGRGVGDTFRFNSLFRNDGPRGFVDVTADAGDLANAEISGMHRGNAFFDYDNDGDLDLYVTNEGVTEIRSNVLYRNDGGGFFTAVNTLAFPPDKGPSGAAAGIGDYNGDGALDIYAPSGLLGRGGPGAFLENRVAQQNHWLVVRLEGVLSHRDAYGARVVVTTGSGRQMRELHTAAVDPQPLHFGLGDSALVDEICVRWPSGIVQRLADVAADGEVRITERPELASAPPACAI